MASPAGGRLSLLCLLPGSTCLWRAGRRVRREAHRAQPLQRSCSVLSSGAQPGCAVSPVQPRRKWLASAADDHTVKVAPGQTLAQGWGLGSADHTQVGSSPPPHRACPPKTVQEWEKWFLDKGADWLTVVQRLRARLVLTSSPPCPSSGSDCWQDDVRVPRPHGALSTWWSSTPMSTLASGSSDR